MYSGMNDYQKSFLTDEQVELMKKYVKKMKDMVASAENKGDDDGGDGDDDGDGDDK